MRRIQVKVRRPAGARETGPDTRTPSGRPLPY